MASTTPKRLEPTKETIRELFVKSGNECAFPGCNHRIIDEDGVYVAEMCHIEAAEPGGERFNASMDNEQRRQYSNLMLMCHAHHVVTNNVVIYTVDRLREMKRTHESRYAAAPDAILRGIQDECTHAAIVKPQSLEKLNEVLAWGHDEQELTELSQEVSDLAERLGQVPKVTRQLLLSIVRRAKLEAGVCSRESALCAEVSNACGLSEHELSDHVKVLERYGIAELDIDPSDGAEIIVLKQIADGEWAFWSDVKSFCEKTGVELIDFVVEMRFNLLD